jgi:hypothetical protein
VPRVRVYVRGGHSRACVCAWMTRQRGATCPRTTTPGRTRPGSALRSIACSLARRPVRARMLPSFNHAILPSIMQSFVSLFWHARAPLRDGPFPCHPAAQGRRCVRYLQAAHRQPAPHPRRGQAPGCLRRDMGLLRPGKQLLHVPRVFTAVCLSAWLPHPQTRKAWTAQRIKQTTSVAAAPTDKESLDSPMHKARRGGRHKLRAAHSSFASSNPLQ